MVPARDLIMFSFVLAFLMVSLMCLEKVCMVSKVAPRNLGVLSYSIGSPLMMILGLMLASLVSGVKYVTGDFSGETMRSPAGSLSM